MIVDKMYVYKLIAENICKKLFKYKVYKKKVEKVKKSLSDIDRSINVDIMSVRRGRTARV